MPEGIYAPPECGFTAPVNKAFDHWKMSGADGLYDPDDPKINSKHPRPLYFDSEYFISQVLSAFNDMIPDSALIWDSEKAAE